MNDETYNQLLSSLPNYGACWVCGEPVLTTEPHDFYQYTWGELDENNQYPIFAVHADEYPGDAFAKLLSPIEYEHDYEHDD